MSPNQSPGRILGIGGIFFKSHDHEGLRSWYQNKLGLLNGDYGGIFKWRSHDDPACERCTVWSIFPSSTAYFIPSESTFMINYIVDNLEAFLQKCVQNGVRINAKREDHSYGRFAWIYDPDGNKIELWEPLVPTANVSNPPETSEHM